MKLKAIIASFVLLTSVPIVSALQKEVEASEISKQELFFNQHGHLAQEVAKEYDIYASVLLAQMALESSYGKSGLASNYNNYFGIKGNYNGKTVQMKTKEDDGSGSLYSTNAGFRAYENSKQSMIDYAELMNKDRYKKSLKSVSNSYQEVTSSLQGVYATDTRYSEKLNGIIEKYNLTKFDVESSGPRGNVVQDEIDFFGLKVQPFEKSHSNSAQVYSYNAESSFEKKEKNVHIVIEGESLSTIANKYSTTIEKIMSDNGLSSFSVYKGESLVIL